MLWGLEPNAIGSVIASTGKPETYDAYVDTAIQTHPDRNVAANLLMARMFREHEAGNTGALARDVLLVKEKFADTWLAKMATRFDPERVIRVGQPIPDFAFADSQHPALKATREDLLGGVYLLDFWATWCKPCVAAIPNLRATQKRFSDCGFRVVAVAIDDKKPEVEVLKEREPMPWLVSVAEPAASDELRKRFEIAGLPTSILVGADGNVLATSEQIHGPLLAATLETVCQGRNRSNKRPGS
jgi:thiol-disulfide isomerase/thioredoxin